MIDGVARAWIRLSAALLGKQRADPEPAGLGEVVVEVVDLHVEDELVARDRRARGGEVAGGVGVQQVAAAGSTGARGARRGVQGQQHERGAADGAEEPAPAHAEPPGLGVRRLVGPADGLGLDRGHRGRDVLAVRARTELDG